MPIYPGQLHDSPAAVRATIMLRNRRRSLGLDFGELAAALGIPVRDYVEKETGRAKFTTAEQAKLTAILGMDFDDARQTAVDTAA